MFDLTKTKKRKSLEFIMSSVRDANEKKRNKEMNRGELSAPREITKQWRAKLNVNSKRFLQKNWGAKQKIHQEKAMLEERNTELRQRRIVHRERIIPARSPFFSSSYLIDTDREFTAESTLTRKSLWKCSWGPGASTHIHTLSQPALSLVLCHPLHIVENRHVKKHKLLTIYQK